MTKSNKCLIIDVIALILHLLIFIGTLMLSVLLIAPMMGIEPDSEELMLASFFGSFSFLILFLNIIMLRKRTNKMLFILAGATLLWMSLWCVLVSAYDMIGFIMVYLVVTIPLLFIRIRCAEFDKPSG